jgi:alkyl sulfatase BDS1-like metallo-beta-lactamase superfamily hydrolase
MNIIRKLLFLSLVANSSLVMAAEGPDLETRLYSKDVYSAGDNPYKVERYAPQYYIDHGKHFAEGTHKHPGAPIWSIIPPNSFATIHVIDAPEGLILVDTGLNREQMEPVSEIIKTLSDKPIKVVIYTHAHADHTSGVGAFVTREQVTNGEVEVIADYKFLDAYISENAATGPLMGQRAFFMYGGSLQPADQAMFTTGCCGFFSAGSADFIAPTYTAAEDTETRDVLGLELTFVHTGGENSAHLVIYSPKYKTIFTGDELQGPAGPQLHSPRGTKFRDTNAWVAAIDRIRALNPEHMLPGHGQPEYGKENVDRILLTYRDAMQFQHDQAIRLINQGKSPDDLANEIVMPEYLILDPFTIQTYGNVKTNVRSFFTGYVSWFDGNPANLDPLPKIEEDTRLVAAMGGREKVIKLAEQALQDGDIRWSVALSDRLVRIDNKDMQARYLKAAGLRHLGYATINSSNRGFYLGAADELDGLMDMNQLAAIGRNMMMGPNVITGMPTANLMETMRYKVIPDQVKDTNTGYYFQFDDTGEEFTLYLRNGILEIQTGKQQHQVSIRTNRQDFDRFFTETDTPALIDIGEVSGDEESVALFDRAIDQTFYPIRLGVQ